ncbi:MAG: YceI family protein [Pseudomonadota bacterium]
MRVIAAALALTVITGCGQGGSSNDVVSAQSAAPNLAATNWTLDTDASRIAFASIKSGELIETHFFPGLTGDISESGDALISIPLDLVETKIDQRDERMREMFFNTAQFPTATLTAKVDPQAYADLPVGGRTQAEIEGTLSLHGVDAVVYADVFVTRIALTRIEVASAEPVVIYVADHGLEAGLEALRDVAALPSITGASPVTFTLVFEAQS